MRDRVPATGKANRVRIRMDDGQVIEGVLEYADDAVQAGSVYNKGNVLPDSVCDALEIDRVQSEPKDAFAKLKYWIEDEAQKRQESIDLSNVVVGTYDGDGEASRIIDLGFYPSVVILCSNRGFSPEESGMATRTIPVSVDGQNRLMLVPGGFTVYYQPLEAGRVSLTNSPSLRFSYAAFRFGGTE